ncbi:MAG: hypothetical protein RJQ07_09540 [Pseudomonadales bacterium]
MNRFTILLMTLVAGCATGQPISYDRTIEWQPPTEDVSGNPLAERSVIAYEIYAVEVDLQGNIVRPIKMLMSVPAYDENDQPVTQTTVNLRVSPSRIAMKATSAEGTSDFSNVQSYYYK